MNFTEKVRGRCLTLVAFRWRLVLRTMQEDMKVDGIIRAMSDGSGPTAKVLFRVQNTDGSNVGFDTFLMR